MNQGSGMERRVSELILAFAQEASDMLHEFLLRAGLESPFDWRRAGLTRQGYIRGRPRIIYRFHGAGLRLRIGNRRIDFDFDYEGQPISSQEWFLWLFAKDRPKQFPEFQDVAFLRNALAATREVRGQN